MPMGLPQDIVIVVFLGLLLGLSTFWWMQMADVSRRQFPDGSAKVVWILVLLFTSVLGAAVYCWTGKKQGSLRPATR